nr:zinc finger, CCHC-type [Tanacetum cinerariifolium]
MEFFKGKTYDQILLIFQARFDANMKFLFKTREEMEKEDKEIIKSINETPAQKAAKKRKLSEEAQEADNLRGRLEIVRDEDDDVFVEAIPLAQKVPVVDYQVVVIDNKPRPDSAFGVRKLSRYTSNPGTQHWQGIQMVLKYLKKTMDYRLVYSSYPLVLEGYTDASWISNTEDNSSTSGWVFLLGRGAISWASKKQTCITGSTMKSVLVALAAAGKEAEWMCLEPAGKEDGVANFSMVNFFEKVLSRSMNKEEPSL